MSHDHTTRRTTGRATVIRLCKSSQFISRLCRVNGKTIKQ